MMGMIGINAIDFRLKNYKYFRVNDKINLLLKRKFTYCENSVMVDRFYCLKLIYEQKTD